MIDAFPDANIDDIIRRNRHTILEGIFGTQTSIQVESSISFARYLSHVGINQTNYLLFLRIIETNNKWVIDGLIGKRDPRLLFTVIKPNRYLAARTFNLLSLWHPGQIYSKVLLAVLGIVEYCYYKPDEGYRIYNIDISDMNNLAKFLDEDKDQFDLINSAILDILDKLTKLGEFRIDSDKSMLSKHAFNIRIAYFDNSKSLTDVIPTVLLVRLKREDREVNPTHDYMEYLKKTIGSTGDEEP